MGFRGGAWGSPGGRGTGPQMLDIPNFLDLVSQNFLIVFPYAKDGSPLSTKKSSPWYCHYCLMQLIIDKVYVACTCTGCVKKTRRIPTVASRCAVVVDTRWKQLSSNIIATASTTGAAMSSARRAPKPSRSVDVDRTLSSARSKQRQTGENAVKVGGIVVVDIISIFR